MSPFPTPRGEWTTGLVREGKEAAPHPRIAPTSFTFLRSALQSRSRASPPVFVNLPAQDVNSQIEAEPRRRVGSRSP
jgi:hypothetical protein